MQPTAAKVKVSTKGSDTYGMSKPHALRHARVALCVGVGALVLGVAGTTVLAPPAAAAADRVFMAGDSLTWQACQGSLQRFPAAAPRILRDFDGGCYGWSGATTADFLYEVQGGRFQSNGDGQPHPLFDGRGHGDPWSVREAMDRASVLIIGLGTNEAVRAAAYTGVETPWPIQLGPGHVPGYVSAAEMAANIDYVVWLAQGRPVFWYDVGVSDPTEATNRYVQSINDEIWSAQARHPNFRVLPWSTKVREDPGLVRGRDVHMTDRGRDVRWALAADAVRGAVATPR